MTSILTPYINTVITLWQKVFKKRHILIREEELYLVLTI